MKKLKNKVFFLITTILTLFLITILSINNYQNYSSQKEMIDNNLHRMNPMIMNEEVKKDTKIIPKKEEAVEKEEPHKMFMDAIIYTVLLDDNDNIKEVISHYDSDTNTEEIEKVAKEILSKKNINSTYIGNLYFNKYSYSYTKNNTLIIIDNTNANEKLIKTAKTSLILFIILEIIIIEIATLLTKWIIKPVEESFEKQKTFIADASHELKTPLAVIMASSESLETDKNSKKLVDNIKNESERMNKLIANLLDLAKLENNSKKSFTEINLSKTIEKSVLTFESLSFEKNVLLDYDIEENITLSCDQDEIKQLVSILMDNAIKHSEKDSKIFVKLKKEKNSVLLEVKNKGDEIPKGEEEKIFERFYRVDKSRNRKENRYGLGLAIAKKIVENHSGKITASSESGYTTFRIIFKKK